MTSSGIEPATFRLVVLIVFFRNCRIPQILKGSDDDYITLGITGILDFVRRPVSLKNPTFQKLDLFPRCRETPTLLGPLERVDWG
jgi:hypothetical protein